MPQRRFDQDDPPRVRRGRPGGRLALIAGGVLVAVLLVVVVFSINVNVGKSPQDAKELEEPAELVPDRLTAEDLKGSTFDLKTDEMLPVLERGGWVQVPDETGQLAQRYRFARLDPHPQGQPAHWVEMTRPRAEIYRSDGRVISLSGDSALVHLPQRTLASGTLTGNVTIRVFEPSKRRVIDPESDTPSLVVHTERADFDNFLGEIRCDGDFAVETPNLEFRGRELVLLINDRDEQVAMAVTTVEEIRLAGEQTRHVVEPAGTEPSPEMAQVRSHDPGRRDSDITARQVHDQAGQPVPAADLPQVIQAFPGSAVKAPAPEVVVSAFVRLLIHSFFTGNAVNWIRAINSLHAWRSNLHYRDRVSIWISLHYRESTAKWAS